MKTLLLTVTLFVLLSCSNDKKTVDEPFIAGFKIIQTKDSSRVYKPGTDSSDYLYYRPIDIDIWYPAKVSSTDTSLHFRNLIGLLGERANYYAASKIGDGISQQLAQYFCETFKCSDSATLLNSKTLTFRNAQPAEGKYPLVLYLSSFNGMSFENFMLFEELAKNGFVVACISSIGRFPGDMTMKTEDLIEQVNDAIVTVQKLEGSSSIDFGKIGIVGYSWGGLSGSILASKLQRAACLISLEGSEFHHYGQNKDEDLDFDSTRYSSYFKEMRLSIPYLRLESSPAASSEKLDSVYNFAEKISSNVQLFVIDSARHEDFGCLPKFVRVSGNCNSDSRFNTITKLTLSFLSDHLKGKKSFTETINEEIAGKRLYEKVVSKPVNERPVKTKENTTNTRIEDKIIDTIISLKEVKDRARYIEEQSRGKNHLKIWTAAIPDLPTLFLDQSG